MAHQKTFIERLVEILMSQGVVRSNTGHDLIEQFERSTKENFEEFLIDELELPTEDVLRALSAYYKVPAFEVRGYFFDHDLLTYFPLDFLLRNAIIPIEVDEDVMVIAASEPEAPGLRDAIAGYTSDVVEFKVGLRQEIVDAVREFYDYAETQVEALDFEKGADEIDENIVDRS